jgi:CelD/BcsL family acetyltransferase involved in cellulose biosynthesis
MNILEDPSADFAWAVVDDCPYATFYHTPLWHRLAVESGAAHKDRAFGVEFDNGTRALLPLLQKRRMLQEYVSTFAGCYGGLVADGPIPDEAAATFFEHVLSLRGKQFLFTSNPLASPVASPSLRSDDVEADFTHILELDGDLDAIVDGYSRGHRSSLKKGRREGVVTRTTHSVDGYRKYFEAYEASMDRWGKDPSTGYSWDFFANACALSQEYPETITLWLATVDDDVASGALIFRWNQHVSYWHGAAHEEYFDYRPNNVLHTDIISAALDDGYRYYDFNPSGGHDGVAQFKSRFGAQKQSLERRTYTRSLLEAVLGS